MSIPGRRPESIDKEHPMATSACPRWCDPGLCTAAAGGNHQSAPMSVPARGGEVCAAEVWMGCPSGSDAALLTVELHYDPDFCAALGVPAEPDAFVLSRGQARQLRWTLGQLLGAA